ncbi:hypothetical protein [uncultured Aquimarina sp.]|uniref:hypothetical protein n=1 Tax=uncultured Aquimarina sp. TaxID=575652 RepID=UPI002618541B|nr:hypothetical protein [uncultured Aquimarina sp.]
MKNRYLILLILTLVAFAIYVWNYPPYEFENSIDPNVKNGSTTPETVVNPPQQNEAVCMDYLSVEPPTMHVKLIDEMTKLYKNQIGRGIKPNDAQAIWFDFETLKRFLYYIEYYSEKHDIPLTDLGVRAYYANYPSMRKWDTYRRDLNMVPKNYEKKHTLILIPTIKRNNIDYDFNPKDRQSYYTPLNRIYSFMNEAMIIPNPFSQPSSLRVLGLSNDRTTSRNHGSLFPPDPSTDKGVSFPLR